MTIKLIVGLQNPGSAYEHTRHNAGAWFVEKLAEYFNISFLNENKFHGKVALLESEGHACRLLLPSTFMNLSGLPVRTVCQFYRLTPDEVLIAHDELDLAPGRIKLKSGGGNGGHNGLKDIHQQLQSNMFHRLRIGIGHPGDKSLVLNYVLGKPSQADKKNILDAIDKSIAALPLILRGEWASAMNQVNN